MFRPGGNDCTQTISPKGLHSLKPFRKCNEGAPRSLLLRTYVSTKCVLYRIRVEPFHLRTYPFTYLAFSSSWARAGRGARGPGFRGIRVEPFHQHHFPRIVSGLSTSGIWSSQHLLRTYVLLLRSPSPPAPRTGACPREPRLHQCFIPGP